MFVVVLLFLAIIGIWIWQFIETRNALATTSVESRYSPQQCAQLIGTAFEGARTLLWTDQAGPGAINKRRRGYKRGITMSIDVQPLADGGTRVDMWASQYLQYFFALVNFAGVVNRRKRAIARLLTQPGSQPAGDSQESVQAG